MLCHALNCMRESLRERERDSLRERGCCTRKQCLYSLPGGPGRSAVLERVPERETVTLLGVNVHNGELSWRGAQSIAQPPPRGQALSPRLHFYTFPCFTLQRRDVTRLASRPPRHAASLYSSACVLIASPPAGRGRLRRSLLDCSPCQATVAYNVPSPPLVLR